MKYCKYCKTKVDTTNDFCPLCFNHIEELDNSYEQFFTPRRRNETADRKKHFIFKLFLFLTICAITTCFLINFLVNPTVQWSLVVAFGLIYVWVLVSHTIMSRQSAVKKCLLQVISIFILLYFTERVANSQKWLMQYVYPSISFTVIFVLLMILFIDKNRSCNIFGFTVLIILMGVVSFVLLLFNLVEFKLLNLINCVFTVLTVLGMLIFGSRTLKQELSKRFHL